MFIYLNKRGQSTLEYGLVIAVVVAALIAMQAYFKRGLQGKLKQASDDIGEQYSPDATNSTITVSSLVNSTETVTVDQDGRPTTRTTSSQKQDRNSSVNIGALNKETW